MTKVFNIFNIFDILNVLILKHFNVLYIKYWMDILNGYFFLKVTRQFRMYTYRIRGKRGPFKIILPASFCSFLTLPGMSGSPSSFSDYQYFYSFMDRNVHAHFYRQSDHYWRYPLNERILSGIVHFLFFGKIMQKQVLYFS